MTDTSTAAPDARAADRYELRLLVILFLSFGFVFFDRQALSFLAPYMDRDFGLSNAELGTLSGVLALTWALAGMFAGRLSDALGRRKPILVVAVVLFSLFSASSGLMGGFAGLLVARALMGTAEGAVLPMAQSLMVEASRESRRGFNMGLLQGSSAGLLGGIVAPLVVVWLAETYDWRVAFYVTIVPGLIMAALIWKFVRERAPRAPQVREETVKVPLGEVLRLRNIVVCMLIACCYLTWFVTIITFTPTYLTQVKGFDPGTMSGVMTCLGVAWVLWGFATPAISDRIGRKPALIGFTALAVCCPLAVVFVESPVLLGALMVVTYTGLGCFTLFMATIPAETVPRAALATALGVIMGVGELAGGFLGPMVAGWASDQWGLRAAMFIAAAGALAVVGFCFLLKETAPAVLRRRAAA
ncbi:Major facilitator family transporter [[Actinomadura] parvosata subsp. kistnae]|uniref:MFS transporter n=1 Tax=[Actinomadura] parvosata subsp. kistnae TaxID=1909395 RepID=A0A1V0A4L6_9ACTN|nr:MFS transporter [Nonomuraea sp. ATCC 55076]AQZ65141.1 MFS transporter [Nonomuraea sp. ATCC 55076]SPL96428.1 Major facilitator family transporter [Actinomadura parvosata subsp. kistnae]